MKMNKKYKTSKLIEHLDDIGNPIFEDGPTVEDAEKLKEIKNRLLELDRVKKELGEKDEAEEITMLTIPDGLLQDLNEALELYFNKNLLGADLIKVEIIPSKNIHTYGMTFYYRPGP